MAPRDMQEQTFLIVQCLLEDEYTKDRSDMGDIQTDAEDDDDSFDAVIIADKLREFGDELQESVMQKFRNDIQTAPANKRVKAFSSAVDMVCKMWMSETGEVASEKHQLKAAVMLALYVKKNCPDMKSIIQAPMVMFLNARVTPWVGEQGGWDTVASE
ncbi:hypothetical protein AAFF_G00060240 [Aldrovandia affinis]|uniref:Uncharacterized protein n=1 Tax=Aldrovandia affinis TaxID=143900 RepID=A0AAD7WDW6_9TELE|nr:hypothetical protein AAFF_G00060240 [Aldrovandia affinis]